MDINKLKRLSAEDREKVFEAEAANYELETFAIDMTEEEIVAAKDDLAKASIKKATIDEEFADVKEHFKQRLKPVTDEISGLITAIKTGRRMVTDRVYRLPDLEAGTMYEVDRHGNVINSRPLKSEERQYKMKAS